jgi:circadian clock protein KaiB
VKRDRKSRTTKAFEKAVTARRADRYILRLYVAGASDRSRLALARARRLCDVELKGHCELEVIDVYQQPILARDGQIIATPTLVKAFPLPVRRFIGTLESTARICVGLDLRTRGESRP